MLGMPIKGDIKQNDNNIKYQQKENKTEDKVINYSNIITQIIE